jgi:murein tripeptide amidase MpaA
LPVVPPLDTSRYYLYRELSEYMQEVEAAAPHLVRLFSIGESHGGRPLLLAQVTNQGTGEASDKPALWLDGNMHAMEVAGCMACLDVLYRLASGHGREEFITHLLDTTTFYILPRLAVDGAEHCLTTGDVVRSGLRPYPFEDEMPGLVPGDVDGDGRILQMRQVDPLGEWKASRRDPRLLLRRSPDDRQGPFYRLYREGSLVGPGGEGPLRVAGSPFGLDFNRNFPCDWRPEAEQKGSGPYPLSEPETRAVADFFRLHPNIGAVLSFHSFSSVLLRPYASRPDSDMPPEDLRAYRELGQRASEITGYPCLSIYHGFRSPGESLHGLFHDWAYHHRGAVAFSSEIWNIGLAAGLEIRDPVAFLHQRSEADMLAILRWLDREAPGQGFIPWKPFQHPQLGPVEIGGWNLLTSWFNPPPGVYLEEEIRRNSDLALMLAAALPRLALRSCRDEVVGWALGSGEEAGRQEERAGPVLVTRPGPAAPDEERAPLRRIVLELENQGYLPTWVTRRARDAGLAGPATVELALEGDARLVLGSPRQELAELAGSGTVHTGAWSDPVWFAGQGDQARCRLEWLVAGAGEVQVRVRHPRAGSLQVKVGASGARPIPAALPPTPIYTPQPAPLAAAAPPPRAVEASRGAAPARGPLAPAEAGVSPSPAARQPAVPGPRPAPGLPRPTPEAGPRTPGAGAVPPAAVPGPGQPGPKTVVPGPRPSPAGRGTVGPGPGETGGPGPRPPVREAAPPARQAPAAAPAARQAAAEGRPAGEPPRRVLGQPPARPGATPRPVQAGAPGRPPSRPEGAEQPPAGVETLAPLRPPPARETRRSSSGPAEPAPSEEGPETEALEAPPAAAPLSSRIPAPLLLRRQRPPEK